MRVLTSAKVSCVFFLLASCNSTCRDCTVVCRAAVSITLIDVNDVNDGEGGGGVGGGTAESRRISASDWSIDRMLLQVRWCHVPRCRPPFFSLLRRHRSRNRKMRRFISIISAVCGARRNLRRTKRIRGRRGGRRRQRLRKIRRGRGVDESRGGD